MNPIVCSRCNSENVEGQASCASCGNPVTTREFNLSDFVRCRKCGLEWNAHVLDSCPGCARVNVANRLATGRSGTGMRINAGNVILTTGQEIPGRTISEIIGLIFAAGNAAWTLEGTSNKSNTAMGKASENLMRQAWQLGADAVVAIQMSIDGSGTTVNRSQTVTLIGTAVKISPIETRTQ